MNKLQRKKVLIGQSQLEKEKKTGVVTGLDKQAELEKKEQQEEEEKARVVRDDLSRSIRTPAGVVHVLRKTKQYADSYAEKVKTFHDEAEAQYKVVEAAVATLAHETGQQFTKSYFSHGAYTAIASVIASSAGEYKNLKHETTAAAKTIDRALVRLVTELNVTKQFTHLESLDDADNTATSIDGIREALSPGRFVFNLGHGIQPQTPITHVEEMLARIRGAA